MPTMKTIADLAAHAGTTVRCRVPGQPPRYGILAYEPHTERVSGETGYMFYYCFYQGSGSFHLTQSRLDEGVECHPVPRHVAKEAGPLPSLDYVYKKRGDF